MSENRVLYKLPEDFYLIRLFPFTSSRSEVRALVEAVSLSVCAVPCTQPILLQSLRYEMLMALTEPSPVLPSPGVQPRAPTWAQLPGQRKLKATAGG